MLFVFGDLHLGGSLRMSLRELKHDSFNNFRRAVDMILKRANAPTPESQPEHAVIFSGDIFHRNRISGLELDTFFGEVLKLYKAGIRSYFIQGNHDMSEDVPLARAIRYPVHLDGELLQIAGYAVYGLDYCNRTLLQKRLEEVPDCDILVLHAGLERLLGYEGAFELSAEDIPSKVKQFLIAGHVHVNKVLQIGKLRFISPGALVACTLRQGGPKGFYVLNPGVKEPQFVEVPTRPILTFEYSDPAGDDLVEAAVIAASTPVPEEGMRPILHVRYQTAVLQAYREALAKCDMEKVLFFDTREGTVEKPENALEETPKDVVSMGAMLPFVAREDSPEFHLASDLLLSEKPVDVIEGRIKAVEA